MGNVNESKAKGRPSSKDFSASPVLESTPDVNDSENIPSSVLDDIASDMPMKLSSTSESGPNEPSVRPIAASKDTEQPTIRIEVAYSETVQLEEDLPREDSFPLSESAIPISFDLLAGMSPNLSDSSDIFHTPDMSELDIVDQNIFSSHQSLSNTMDLWFPPLDEPNINLVLPPQDSLPQTKSDTSRPANEASLARPQLVDKMTSVNQTQRSRQMALGRIDNQESIGEHASCENHKRSHCQSQVILPQGVIYTSDECRLSHRIPSPNLQSLEDKLNALNEQTIEGSRSHVSHTYRADEYLESSPLSTSNLAAKFVQEPKSDIYSPLSLPSLYIPLPTITNPNAIPGTHDAEGCIPAIHLVATPAAIVSSSSEREIKTFDSLDMISSVLDGGAESKGRRGPKPSELPVTISHLLNISTESFGPQSEYTQLSCYPTPNTQHENPVIGTVDPLPITHNENPEQKRSIHDDVKLVQEFPREPAYSRHCSERPNWAVAPDESPAAQKGAGKGSSKVDSKRTTSRRGKQKVEMISSTRKTNSGPDVDRSFDGSRFKFSPHSNLFQHVSSDQSTISNAAVTLFAAPSDNLNRANSVPFQNVRENTEQTLSQTRPNIGSGDSTPAYNHSSNKFATGRRVRSGSVSFRSVEFRLPPIREITTAFEPQGLHQHESASTLCSSFSSLSLASGTSGNTAETVEDKIAAILSDRRNKPVKVQPVNHSAASKMASQTKFTGPQVPPSTNKHGSHPRQSRVSWPTNEQEQQANDPPLLPRISRALSLHLTPSHDAQPLAARNQTIRKSNGKQELSHPPPACKRLQVGYDEFPLHDYQRDEPVRVNLPGVSKLLKSNTGLPRSNSSPIGHPSTHSVSHSHTPAATRNFVNSSIITADGLVPATSFSSPEDWVSSVPFPQATSPNLSEATEPQANTSHIGHRCRTVPQADGHLQDSVKGSQSIHRLRIHHLAHHNLSNQITPSDSRSSVATGSGAQSQYPFSALRRVKSREFSNISHLQGQYHERKHVDNARSNYAGSSEFALNFRPVSDVVQWRYNQPPRFAVSEKFEKKVDSSIGARSASRPQDLQQRDMHSHHVHNAKGS